MKKGFTRTNFASQNSRGFTLMELLIVMSIIAIITAIGLVSYAPINKRSRDAKRKSDLEQVRSALEMYRSDNGYYPGSSASFDIMTTALNDSLVVPTPYLPSIPMDPKSTSTSPVYYYYSPLPPLGTSPFYSYCICANLESESGSNTCGTTLPAECNYGLKNP